MIPAVELDDTDPLANFRDLFVHSPSDSDLIYLDGNSLGRQPIAVRQVLEEVVDQQWAERLIRGWNEGWLEISSSIGDLIGELIGAQPGEVILAENTSTCVYKAAVAALRVQSGKGTVVTDNENFPSDIQILRSACVAAGSNQTVTLVDTASASDPTRAVLEAIDASTALVSLSHVSYKAGWRWDLQKINKAAAKVGALVLWDFSHSVGAIPIDVEADGVALAVGCTYKYLNGGPGAPAFIYIRADQHDLANPITGWFGTAEPFSFDESSPPASGIERFLTGTPHVVSAALVRPGLDMLLEAGMDRVYEKSVALSERFIQLCDEHLSPSGFEVRSPRDPEQRGSHVAVFHPDAQAVGLALINEQSVIPDFRPPDILRFGFAPLYTSFTDIDSTVNRIIKVVESGGVDRWRNENPLVP